MNAHQIVEAVLFASDAPLTADEIARADENLDEDQVEQAIEFLTAEYGDADRSFQIVEVGEGYQILTRPEFAPYLERFDNVPRPSRLSGPALETLAIIAYRQPLGRVEMEYIRGVGSSGVIRTLQDRQMIDVVGRGEGLGRPLLYGTTQQFLEHFGFKSLESLPRPEELPVILRERVPLGPPDEEETDDQEELALDGGGDGAVEGDAEERKADGDLAGAPVPEGPDDGGLEAEEVEEAPEGAPDEALEGEEVPEPTGAELSADVVSAEAADFDAAHREASDATPGSAASPDGDGEDNEAPEPLPDSRDDEDVDPRTF